MTLLTFKKSATLVAALGFAFSLAACGNQTKGEATKPSTASTDTATITLDFENDKKVDETKKVTIKKIKPYLKRSKTPLKLKKKTALSHQSMVKNKTKQLKNTGCSISMAKWPIREQQIFT